VRNELIKAIEANRGAFDVELSSQAIERLADFYEIVQRHNALLHLVAPCTAEEFAVRHILESLMLLECLADNARFADVGTGAGLPSIPCLIARNDVTAVLIEGKEKKARYLEDALIALGLTHRATVVNKQFEEVREKVFDLVTCRALDRFTDKLPRLLRWAGDRKCVFFGGPSLREPLIRLKVSFEERLLPLSKQRFLFITR